MRIIVAASVVAVSILDPTFAFAQRFPFERTLQISSRTKLDVKTVRGKVDIVAGAPGRIVVDGDATVRVGWDVPANASEIARQIAASPPIEQTVATVKLALPDRATQRAVTLSYRIQVPPDTEVQISTSSGETSVSGIAGSVDVRTQSGTIVLRRLDGVVRASTGSGAVAADVVTGGLSVTTGSSSFKGIGLGSSLWVRTQSGQVEATFTEPGDVDVETGSSAIHLTGIRGALTAKSQSGRLTVQGSPLRTWNATTGSSSVSFSIQPEVGFSLDAATRSGSVVVDEGAVTGSIAKRVAKGTVNGGGPLVKISTGSGSVRVHLERR